ncbi:hypothetical protein [Bacillus sp. FJAT-47783]|nr:hypothetical protein [Bacillus sp. FJAT-47783]
MCWKTSRPKKIAAYAKILNKMHVLSNKQAQEIEKMVQSYTKE